MEIMAKKKAEVKTAKKFDLQLSTKLWLTMFFSYLSALSVLPFIHRGSSSFTQKFSDACTFMAY